MKPRTVHLLIIGTVATALALWSGTKQAQTCCLPLFSSSAIAAETVDAPTPGSLPRLVDLGADKCIQCKMMTPVLASLKKEYAGRMEVAFIDVWKDPEAGDKYGVQIIPTQIFYDAAGKERYRHQGFLAKADILAKWKELGVELSGKIPPQ